jgi:hypothetical protein
MFSNLGIGAGLAMTGRNVIFGWVCIVVIDFSVAVLTVPTPRGR